MSTRLGDWHSHFCVCMCGCCSFFQLISLLPVAHLISGYFRGHGLKSQVVLFPNGMIGSVFVAALRHNDNGMVNLSGLSQYLHSLLTPHVLQSGHLPCAYGDGIFSLLPTIIPRYKRPNEEERRRNMRMSSLRMFEEHIFGDFKTMFPIFQCRHRLRLFETGIFVRQLLVVCFFVYNCRQCLNQSRTRLFGVSAPTIEAYLPLDEELDPPPTVDLGELNDYHYGRNNRQQVHV